MGFSGGRCGFILVYDKRDLVGYTALASGQFTIVVWQRGKQFPVRDISDSSLLAIFGVES